MTVKHRVAAYRTLADPDARKPLNLLLGENNGGVSCGLANTTIQHGAAGSWQQTKLTFAALSITMTDATTNGSHGTATIATFPAGRIAIWGASADLTTLAGAGGIGDTASVVMSVGSAAVGTDNATLTATEADVIPSTAATLAAGAGAMASGSATAQAATVFDGSSTPLDLHLNVAVPDAGSSADDTLAVTGDIFITWSWLGPE